MNSLLTEEEKKLYQDPVVQAVIQLKRERIVNQQKRRMNSFGRWSKMMRDKYEGCGYK
jgi:hypothetical protein